MCVGGLSLWMCKNSMEIDYKCCFALCNKCFDQTKDNFGIQKIYYNDCNISNHNHYNLETYTDSANLTSSYFDICIKQNKITPVICMKCNKVLADNRFTMEFWLKKDLWLFGYFVNSITINTMMLDKEHICIYTINVINGKLFRNKKTWNILKN